MIGTAQTGACMAPAMPRRMRRSPPIMGGLWGLGVIAALQDFQGIFPDTLNQTMFPVYAARPTPGKIALHLVHPQEMTGTQMDSQKGYVGWKWRD